MATKNKLLSFLFIFGLILPLLTNLTSTTVSSISNDFDEVEIRNYEGQDLSTIFDSFNENSIKGTQHIDELNYRLAITGLVNNTIYYTYNEVITGHPISKKVVTLYCVEGWKATIFWEGVLIRDLIEDLQINPIANTVIFYAYDGYSTSLPLSYIIENNIMIAYKMNNITLPAERGYPFQLVAENKWGYKWIKWITEIEISNNPDYQGYWETRGYSKTGNLDEPFYGTYGEDYGDFVDIGGTVPEFPIQLILPLLIIVTLVAVIFTKKLNLILN